MSLVFVLILVGLNGCSDGEHIGALVNDSFELNLTVAGPGNVPLEGVTAFLHVYLPSEFVPKVTKAATAIRFTVPQASDVTLKVYDMDRHVVKTLLGGAVSAGLHEVVFHNDDEGNLLYGIYFYCCEMVASVAGNEVYRGETFMTLYTGIDLQQQPVLGVTDKAGKLTFDDSTEFPFLYNPGPQMSYDENSESRGSFEFTDKVEITLYHPTWDLYTTREVVIGLGRNNIELIWETKTSSPVSTTESVARPAGEVLGNSVGPVPEVYYSIGPAYPSPFN